MTVTCTVALLAAACGSTVQVGAPGQPVVGDGVAGGADRTVAQPLDGGLTIPSSSPSDGPATAAEVGAPPATTASPDQAASTSPGAFPSTDPGASPSTDPGASPSTDPGASPSGDSGHPTASQTYRGVTEETILLGVYGATGYDSMAAGFGVSLAIGNSRNQAQATIDYVNEHGGVAGRKVEMYYIDADIAAAQANPQSQQQAVCTEFTQDAQVYAVATAIANYDLFHECLAQHDTPLFSGGDIKAQSTFERLGPYLYMPGEMNFTRVMRHYGEGLADMGFFDDLGPNADPLATEPVIGLVYGDEPNEEEAVVTGLEPALAAHGRSIDQRAAMATTTYSTSQYANAVLQFRSEGVTHVLFGFAGSPLLFAQAAESQDYNPLYGFHSRSSPASLLQGNVSSDQLAGSRGVGWQPYNDVDANNDPGILNSKQQTCLNIMEGAGEDTSVRATGLVALWYCDTILLFAEAVNASTDLSPAGVQSTVESFGTSFESATTFGTYFGPDRTHDAATQASWFEYGDDCSCFRYTSDPYVVD